MDRILVVEDDGSVREELTLLLRANGYEVVGQPPCELALLDVNLPGESGFELCRRLRMESDVPVIFLTGRDSAEDELLGFGVGADDYIRKPYHSSVLLARMERLLKVRRGASPEQGVPGRGDCVLAVRGLALDLAQLVAEYQGQRLELTKNETRILACLMKKGLCTKEEMVEDLWQNSLYVDENTLYVNVNRLREKLKRAGAVAGAGAALIGLLAGVYLAVVLLWLLAVGLLEGRRMEALEKLIRDLPEVWLLGEVLPKPVGALERRYFRIMLELSRCAVGVAEEARREKEAYCDYVERWIHEMKTPLTACSLILDNGGDGRKLRRELKRADNLTESILYYARLRTMEKDVKICGFSAADVIEEAVKSQMELLIGAGIRVEAEGDFPVYSDRKSVCFMLKQLLVNCAKHCPGCQISIRAAEGTISVRDDGPGILAHELRRVTERGFTGSCAGVAADRTDGDGGPGSGAGRAIREAWPEGAGYRASGGTGMGLYLVKQLCDRLGISLGIASVAGEYTCISLGFHNRG